MGQFKPMVKMKTTEPSVELKLKKGGSVAMAKGGCAPMRKGGMAAMAKGGMMETAMHERNERDEIRRVEKELKSHEGKAASKAHKGLKKGGRACATGGVVNGQTGYKMGGSIPKNGIIKSEKGRSTMSDGAHPKQLKGPTGVVKKGAPAGFKTGGKSVKGCK
jgi:hypothetical protein